MLLMTAIGRLWQVTRIPSLVAERFLRVGVVMTVARFICFLLINICVWSLRHVLAAKS